jgi:branched-chain amino acid transport system permease protein
MAVGGYDGMRVIYKAPRRPRAPAATRCWPAMKGQIFESPRGPVFIDAQTRDVVHNMYIRKVEKKDGQLYNQEFDTIKDVKDPGKTKDSPGSTRNPCHAGRHRVPAWRGSGSPACAAMTILFDGIAYGMLLFILAVGPGRDDGADELHQPRARRLCHGGRLRLVVLMQRHGCAVPGLPAGWPSSARRCWAWCWSARSTADVPQAAPGPGAVLHRPDLHGRGRGTTSWARSSRSCNCPTGCAGAPNSRQRRAGMLGMGHYRLFIIAVCAALTMALQFILSSTRFGSRLRAAVDDPRVAAGLGINVNVVFAATFAVGSGLAGLGGALGAEVLGLDPTFPLKFMVYFLIVVAVGGTSSITGPLLAACCWALPTWRASTTCPSWARSSSTR